ncbi:MAG: 4Fe-4S dicluster domain-containing protein [Ignavibacteria bacterium]|jgi:Fe-S-cluster-containing dehydrogenase component|nr:4Fe-4S dicluster domain-containing protein [Ignavibacteria bacterium]
MKNINRRDFLKTTAAGVSMCAIGTATAKGADKTLPEDRIGILVDTDACVGCRHCEWACRKAHDLPTPELDAYSDESVFKEYRRPDAGSYTVVNKFDNEKNPLLPVHVKFQCMHCDRPACVSACIVGAFTKNDDGSVTWDTDKCIGCRYCMVACPFQVPTYDYDRAIDPLIRKCDLCEDRRKGGEKLPACVAICPNEALIFGKKGDILQIAKKRIKRNPDTYINHIYGEHEVGGTTWIYIASKDFGKLKMPPLSLNPAPGISESIQHGIFAYFVPPVTIYALLGLMMWVTKKRKNEKGEKISSENEKEGGES